MRFSSQGTRARDLVDSGYSGPIHKSTYKNKFTNKNELMTELVINPTLTL